MSRPRPRPPHVLRPGFALREIVLLIFILGTVVLLFAMWALQRREDARRLRCEARLVELAKAIGYHDQLHGGFPGYRNLQAVGLDQLESPTGWAFPLLPFLERDPKSDRPGPWADVYEKYGPEATDEFRGVKPAMYLPGMVCPAVPRGKLDPRTPYNDFVANTGLPDVLPPEVGSEGEAELPLPPDWPANGVLQDHLLPNLAGVPRMSRDYLDKHDGAEHTLLFSENVDSGQWTDADEALIGFVWVPVIEDGEAVRGDELLALNERRGEGQGTIHFARPSSFHGEEGGGANVVYCSGRTQFLSETIDYLVFTQLMTSNGEDLRLPASDKPVPPPYSPET